MIRRMPELRTQAEVDDIEDNQWRRKSYALAQNNALPIPMPLPIHPPPKPIPPPATPVIVWPARFRPPQYPPGQGYRPSAGYQRPSRMLRPPQGGMSARLPTLSEGGSACPTPDMTQRRAVPVPVTPPVAPRTFPQEKTRVISPEYPFTPPSPSPQEKPKFTSFQDPLPVTCESPTLPNEKPRISPHQESPVAPLSNSASPLPSLQQSPAISRTPSPAVPRQIWNASPFSQPLDITQSIPPTTPIRDTHHPIQPNTQSPQPHQPATPHLQSNTEPPQHTIQSSQSPQHTIQSPQPPQQAIQLPQPPHQAIQSPQPPQQAIQSPQLPQQAIQSPQPPQQAIQSPQPQHQAIQSPQPPQPTTKPITIPSPQHATTQPPHPSPPLGKGPPPYPVSPLPRKNPPSLPTKPPPTQRGTKLGRRGIPQPPPSPRPSIPPPPVPTKPPPSPKTQAVPQRNPDEIDGQKPSQFEQERGTQRGPSPSEVIPRFLSGEESPGVYNKPELNGHSPHNKEARREHEVLDPEKEKTEQAPQGIRQTTPPCQQPEEKTIIATPNPEVTQTDIMADNKINSPISQDLPPTPTSQHLPPTPQSDSRPSTPTSLGRPRTPTSIRPAPSWQPIFLPMPKTLTGTTISSEPGTPNSLTPVPTPSPRPLTTQQQGTPINNTSNTQVFPPTPPSSLSHAGQENCTPYSSFNSLSHGPPSKTSMGEDEVQHDPEGGGTPGKETGAGTEKDLHYPAVLDASALHTQATKTPVTVEAPQDTPQDTLSRASHDLEGYQTYRTRFWVLALFSFIAFLQTIVWGTFGPIAESAQAAFPSWTDATIAAFPNWGPIIVVVFTFPMMWLTQKLGLRLGMIVCAILLTLGTVLRCFTSQETPFTILCHVSSILFAFAACLVLSLPAMLAATWFPPSERITATAVGTLMCTLGGAGMYLGSLMVRYPSSENPSDQERQDIRGDIMTLMYTHFGAAALLLVAVCVYFPAQPPTPPSASSAIERIDYFSGVKNIVKNRPLMLVLVVYAFSFGVPVVWIGVLNLSLLELDIHQEQAMGVAVVAVICECIGSFITARIADRMYGHLRVTIMVLLGLSSCFFLWFLLLSTKVIATDLAQVYVAVSGGLCFEYATVPLMVELAVELGYPIPESVIGATLTFVFNVVALVFLGLFQIPDIKHLWVSYVLLACVFLTQLPLFFVKETHKRSDTDRKYIHKDT